MNLSRQEKENSRREDILRQEITNIQQVVRGSVCEGTRVCRKSAPLDNDEKYNRFIFALRVPLKYILNLCARRGLVLCVKKGGFIMWHEGWNGSTLHYTCMPC